MFEIILISNFSYLPLLSTRTPTIIENNFHLLEENKQPNQYTSLSSTWIKSASRLSPFKCTITQPQTFTKRRKTSGQVSFLFLVHLQHKNNNQNSKEINGHQNKQSVSPILLTLDPELEDPLCVFSCMSAGLGDSARDGEREFPSAS